MNNRISLERNGIPLGRVASSWENLSDGIPPEEPPREGVMRVRSGELGHFLADYQNTLHVPSDFVSPSIVLPLFSGGDFDGLGNLGLRGFELDGGYSSFNEMGGEPPPPPPPPNSSPRPEVLTAKDEESASETEESAEDSEPEPSAKRRKLARNPSTPRIIEKPKEKELQEIVKARENVERIMGLPETRTKERDLAEALTNLDAVLRRSEGAAPAEPITFEPEPPPILSKRACYAEVETDEESQQLLSQEPKEVRKMVLERSRKRNERMERDPKYREEMLQKWKSMYKKKREKVSKHLELSLRDKEMDRARKQRYEERKKKRMKQDQRYCLEVLEKNRKRARRWRERIKQDSNRLAEKHRKDRLRSNKWRRELSPEHLEQVREKDRERHQEREKRLSDNP